jgi:hypothetical protein
MARFGLCVFVASFAFAACGGSEFSGEQAGGTGAQADASAGKGGSGASGQGGSGGAQATGGTGGKGGGTGGSDGASGSSGAASGGANGTGGASGGTGASAGTGASGGSSGTTGGTGAAGGASGGAGGTNTDAGSDAARPACPSSPPSDSICAEGLSCSYGDHPLADCRDRYVCTAGGTWLSTHPACAPPPACATLPEFPVFGMACAPHGQDCFLDGGIYCRCAKCPTCTEPQWTCQAPLTPPCPGLLPNLGQPCSHSGSCEYGSCAIESKTRVICDDGTWTWADLPCN